MCSGTLNLPKGEYACRLSPTRGLSATRTKGSSRAPHAAAALNLAGDGPSAPPDDLQGSPSRRASRTSAQPLPCGRSAHRACRSSGGARRRHGVGRRRAESTAGEVQVLEISDLQSCNLLALNLQPRQAGAPREKKPFASHDTAAARWCRLRGSILHPYLDEPRRVTCWL